MADDAQPTVAVLTPICDSEPVELANNVYRKQVIRHGTYNYKGRKLEFTPEYTRRLIEAHKDGAYDAVPLQFAPADNSHTNDIERTRGEIIGFEPSLDGSGLDAIVKADDKAAKVIDRYPKLPVSVRILEHLERADGKRYDAAIQHVLATWDPRLSGMSPWQRVEMSNEDVDHVLDLTELAAPPEGADKEGATVPDNTEMTQGLSDDQMAKLADLVVGKLTAMAEADDADDDGYELPSDEELEQIARAATDADGADDVVQEVAASNGPSQHEIELAERLDRMERENAQLRSNAAERAYVELSRDLAESYGIPPAVTELVKPWLVDARPIELSNGAERTPGEDFVKALKELGKQAKLVDLSGPEPVFAASGLNEKAPADAFTENMDWARQIVKSGQHGL